MKKILIIAAGMTLAGCQSTQIDNSAGRATTYEDTRSVGKVAGVGVESQDTSAKGTMNNNVRSFICLFIF